MTFARQTVASSLFIIAAAVIVSCQTVPKGGLASIDVHVSENSTVSVKGKKIPLSRLGDRLTSLGATRQTRIMVIISRDAPSSTSKRIVDHLVKSRLPKVVIVRKTAPKVFAGPADTKPDPKKK